MDNGTRSWERGSKERLLPSPAAARARASWWAARSPVTM